MGVKYEFDKTRMEFRKVTHSVWAVLGKAVKYFLVTASLAVVYYVVFSFVISTDSERKLKRENQMYRQMYRDLADREELVGDVLEGLKAKDDEIYRRLFNSDAPDLGGIYSNALLSGVDTIPDRLIVEYYRTKLDTLAKVAGRVDANFKRIMEVLSDSNADIPPMTNPLKDFSYARTGASLGEKINPFYKVKVLHGGLDLISQQGEEVVAAADGVVEDVTHSSKGLGNVVTIYHGNGYRTRYAHLENTRVSKGMKVLRGQRIGQVGMSGNSFAPHLHYEVMKDTLRMDPLNYLFASVGPDDYMRMLFMSVNAGQSMD
ncbi:MAG TPA: hypothetical protein DDX40_01070 [Rikenellaceae bacterium]|nr:hypothetical protein [Rikenellaceae bacterium]